MAFFSHLEKALLSVITLPVLRYIRSDLNKITECNSTAMKVLAMFDTVTQKFDLLIGDVFVQKNDNEWAKDFKKQMAGRGFTMVNGVTVCVTLIDPDQSTPIALTIVPVARRLSPIKREPRSRHEAEQVEFMEYRAFFGPKAGFRWGSHIINGIIGDNRGKLPAKWIAANISNDS